MAVTITITKPKNFDTDILLHVISSIISKNLSNIIIELFLDNIHFKSIDEITKHFIIISLLKSIERNYLNDISIFAKFRNKEYVKYLYSCEKYKIINLLKLFILYPDSPQFKNLPKFYFDALIHVPDYVTKQDILSILEKLVDKIALETEIITRFKFYDENIRYKIIQKYKDFVFFSDLINKILKIMLSEE